MPIRRTDTQKPVTVKVHFNRVNMRRLNPNVWTVHTHKACIQVEEVHIFAHLKTVFKPNGKQPRAYFYGKARVRVVGNAAILF